MKQNRILLLALAFLLALMPVMILRDFTPSNELRYLSIADEALREGHLFAFTNQGEPYADKPPLYLWIIMLGKVLFGEHRMWFLALFSFLPALGILCIMDHWTRQALEERNRTTAALMLMTCGLYLGLAVFLRMDMLMCLFITLALYSFWQVQSGGENAPTHRILFPVWILLAIFTKGPIGILVPLVSTVAFLAVKHRWLDIARCWGWRSWAIIGGGCALWFAEVWLEGGSEYLNNLLFHQTLDRAVDAFHHKEPVWYYLVSIWYSLAPWSPLIVAIIGMALLTRIRLVLPDCYPDNAGHALGLQFENCRLSGSGLPLLCLSDRNNRRPHPHDPLDEGNGRPAGSALDRGSGRHHGTGPTTRIRGIAQRLVCGCRFAVWFDGSCGNGSSVS